MRHLALLLCVACSGGPKPPVVEDDGAVTTPPVDAGKDSASKGDADAGVVVPPVCDPKAAWGTPTVLTVSTTSDDRFGTVTADELTIAWMVPTSNGRGSIHYADRASTSDPWGAATTITGEGTFLHDRVALSPDGLTLVATRATKKSFVELTRATRTDDFANAVDGYMKSINLFVMEGAASGALADPLLSLDGKWFVYSYSTQTATSTMRISYRDDPEVMWGQGNAIDQTELNIASGKQRHPTGLSSDLRTLFYYDDADNAEHVAWRPSTSAPFDQFVFLGTEAYAQPIESCKRLYFTDANDLAMADAK